LFRLISASAFGESDISVNFIRFLILITIIEV